MRIADALTVSRALLAGPIALLALQGDALALPLFALAAVTDALDGPVARRAGPTERGAMLDPLADKVLVLATLGALALRGAVPVWVLGLIAMRELGVTWLRLRGGATVEGAGKVKTLLQLVAIAALLAVPLAPASAPAAQGLLLVAVAATLVTGAGYAVRPRLA